MNGEYVSVYVRLNVGAVESEFGCQPHRGS